MKAFVAVSGFKNSGKTTLCLDLASRLEGMGIRVGFVKRTHEAILGKGGTDTGFFLGQGIPTILWGPDGVRKEAQEVQPELEWLVERLMPDVDLVLLEGGKDLPLPRIWVGPPEDCPKGVGGIFARYSREGRTDKTPSFGPGEEDQLASLLAERLVRGKVFPSISLHVDGRNVFLKPYLAKFLQESIQGMLRSLKDTEGRDVYIHIRRRDIPER